MTTYCTQAEMVRFFSSYGVEAFTDHDESGSIDSANVTDAINEGSAEIDSFLLRWYDAATLATSTLVNRWCVKLSLVFMCQQRGNGVPESLQKEFERIMERLKEIRDGIQFVPGLALKSDLRPGMSNMTIDRRFRYSTARVKKANSTDVTTSLSRDEARDYGGYYE